MSRTGRPASDAGTKPASATRTHRARVHASGRDLDIEYYWIAREKTASPLIVFLHEGLGSASMWKHWPDQACSAIGCRGLVFSRYGYGSSTPRPRDEHWPASFLHMQAREALPAFLVAMGLQDEKPILFGHSDGGSIALLYASMFPNAVTAIVVAAPHVFMEDVTAAGIEKARRAYLETDLPKKLRRYHQEPDSAFWGWNDMWLAPDFRNWSIEDDLKHILCPVLAIQGENDAYGTLEQLHRIQRQTPRTSVCVIPDCGHSSFLDQPGKVIDAMKEFIQTLH